MTDEPFTTAAPYSPSDEQLAHIDAVATRTGVRAMVSLGHALEDGGWRIDSVSLSWENFVTLTGGLDDDA